MKPLATFTMAPLRGASSRGGQRVWRFALCLAFCLVFIACAQDERPRSLIDELRTIAVTIDPPESLPTDDITVTTLIADPAPDGGMLEYAVIACTAYNGVSGCLEEIALATEEDQTNGYLTLDESEYRTFFETFVRRGQLAGNELAEQFQVTFTVPLNYYFLFTDYGYDQIDASLFVLVCREGLCPIMDTLDDYLAGDPSAPSGEALMDIISTPGLITSGAPIEGVALGKKAYDVTLNTYARNHNPTFVGTSAAGCAEAMHATGESDRLCQVQAQLPYNNLESYYPNPGSGQTAQEAIVVRFYSTAGEMLPFTGQLQADGTSTLSVSSTLQFPPAEQTGDQVGLFVVAEDSRGGMGYTWLVLK